MRRQLLLIVAGSLMVGLGYGCGSVSPLGDGGGGGSGGDAGHGGASGGESGHGGGAAGGGTAGGGGNGGAVGGGGAGGCSCPSEIVAAPVCGSDGKTYASACHAGCAGVAVAHQGACTDGGTDGGPGAGSCATDDDCVFRPGSCCNGTCAAKTDPLPPPGPMCNIVCPAIQPACGCVNHRCAAAPADAGVDGGRTDGGSAGSVTLRMVLPAGHSFCDSCYGAHITILDGAGQTLQPSVPSCSATCSTCAPPPCPFLPACSQTVPTTSELTWDGTSAKASTCGNNVACYQPAFAPAGHYVARMCATPGKLTTADGGFPSTCNATGSMECVDVPFNFPGPSPIVGTLP